MRKSARALVFAVFAAGTMWGLARSRNRPQLRTRKSTESSTFSARCSTAFAPIYVEKPDDTKLIEAAINGMLTVLDPHSSCMNAKQFRDMQIETRVEFGGLGLEVTMEKGLVKVVAPIEDTPAAKSGLRSGDLITAINREQLQGVTLQEAVEKMRGPVKAPITLTIVRKGVDNPFDVKIIRDVIHIKPVKGIAPRAMWGMSISPASMKRPRLTCRRPLWI